MRYIPNSNDVQAQNAVRQSADRNLTAGGGSSSGSAPKHGSSQQRETVRVNNQQPKRANISDNSLNSAKPVQPPSAKQQKPAENAVEASHKSNPQQNKEKPESGTKNSGKAKGIASLLYNFLPPSVYNQQTKKLFGFLSAEDLLLLALIFLFAESDSEDSSLLSLALLYILVSEHFDLPDLLF